MVKKFTLALGLVLLGVGLWGASTGGHDHNLIIFGINMNHNVVHILSGLLAIVTALASRRAAKWYCISFGSVYGLVAIAGFFQMGRAVTLLNLNAADNFLHLSIALACLYFGFTARTFIEV